MKPNETIFKAKKKYVAIMILCFLFAGFSIISFINHLYGFFWQTSIGEPPRFQDRFGDSNSPRGIETARDANFARISADQMARLASPQALEYLLGGIISILAGITIWGLIREKEIKSIKQETANNLLLPDEKAIIDELKRNGFESTQAKLAKETGLNKVQVHRAIKRLESKGVLEKHEYGLTNKIILKKELFE